MQQLLNSDGDGYRGARIARRWTRGLLYRLPEQGSDCGVLARITIKRAFYHCVSWASGVLTKDQELDIIQDLQELAGSKVTSEEVERCQRSALAPLRMLRPCEPLSSLPLSREANMEFVHHLPARSREAEVLVSK